ncbi:thioredoxin family protein [Shewanella gelidii]|uniref:Glutaredoxin n=1 Tax=Shewanella gelidii TaxID=1642821 RepID=A0A917JUB1_9GAMM|nr:thioredoxin family protein [Shewanella gelidii]MCL1099120.1 thioredoxin family protein [Shewanella gelidii]GGI81628.1 glutaredoxin [Shewanella gelidii]
MKSVKVLGSGCKKCEQTAEIIHQVAADLEVSIELEKVTDMAQIMAYGVMSTPAIVIDEQVVHKGSKPDAAQVAALLS